MGNDVLSIFILMVPKLFLEKLEVLSRGIVSAFIVQGLIETKKGILS